MNQLQPSCGVFNLRQIRARNHVKGGGSQCERGCGWKRLHVGGSRPGAEQRTRPQDSLKTGDLRGASEQNVAEMQHLWGVCLAFQFLQFHTSASHNTHTLTKWRLIHPIYLWWCCNAWVNLFHHPLDNTDATGINTSNIFYCLCYHSSSTAPTTGGRCQTWSLLVKVPEAEDAWQNTASVW